MNVYDIVNISDDYRNNKQYNGTEPKFVIRIDGVTILNLFEVSVIVACAGENNCMKETIRNDIFNKRYIGYRNKFIGKWLKL